MTDTPPYQPPDGGPADGAHHPPYPPQQHPAPPGTPPYQPPPPPIPQPYPQPPPQPVRLDGGASYPPPPAVAEPGPRHGSVAAPTMGATGLPFPEELNRVLGRAANDGASDVHLASGQPPWIRQGGSFEPWPDARPLSPEIVQRCAEWAGGTETLAASSTYTIDGIRWRVTSYICDEGWRVAFRIIPESPADFSTLGLPDYVRGLSSYKDGLVITAGATGSGKTTTLASLIDIIVRSRPVHLLTIEDPVEYHYQTIAALVTHRQLGPTLSREEAWATAMRSDPDVVLFGEMRRQEDIPMCMELASSGHLVFTTIHARDSGTVCERIAAATGDGGRSVLAQVLRAIITQKLVPDAVDPKRRHVAAEILMMDNRFRNLIRPGGRLTGIESALADQHRSLDSALARLVRENKITRAEGESSALVPDHFAAELQQTG